MATERTADQTQVRVALGDAVTRAIHWAPEGLLVRMADTSCREVACRRLAIRVVSSLAGDGWTEGRCARGSEGLHAAVAAGLGQAGEGIITVLSEARRCNGRLLEGIGLHIGGVILAAMNSDGARIKRMKGFRGPEGQQLKPQS